MLVGPSRAVVTRRKDRLVGIWVNRDSHTLCSAGFYAVATKPIFRNGPGGRKGRWVASTLILRRRCPASSARGYGRLPRRLSAPSEADSLYRNIPAASADWARTCGRPCRSQPRCRSAAGHVLFGDGSALAEQVSGSVVKTGFRTASPVTLALVGDLALLSVFMLFTGWLGGVLFRRD